MARRISPLAYPLALVAGACAMRLACGPAFSTGMAARREMLGAVATGMVALNGPLPALADWQGEPQRERKKYGSQILKLEGAVSKGDLEALKPKLRKFEILPAAYRNDAKMQAKVQDITDKIIDAVQEGKKDVVKTEYDNLLKLTKLRDILKKVPVPKGARIVDLGSSGSGMSKFALDETA